MYSIQHVFGHTKRFENLGAVRITHGLNVFYQGLTAPMQYNELKGIAKSISRYCWKKDAYCYQEFIDRQTRKGKLGGLKGKGGRPSLGEPWKKLAISRATYFNWKKTGKI